MSYVEWGWRSFCHQESISPNFFARLLGKNSPFNFTNNQLQNCEAKIMAQNLPNLCAICKMLFSKKTSNFVREKFAQKCWWNQPQMTYWAWGRGFNIAKKSVTYYLNDPLYSVLFSEKWIDFENDQIQNKISNIIKKGEKM